MKLVAAITLVVVLAGHSLAHSAILDQSLEDYDAITNTTNGGLQGQSFTVGITGDLVRIEAALRGGELGQFSPSAKTVELRLVRMRNDSPSLVAEDILALDSTTFAAGTFPPVLQNGVVDTLGFQWVSFDLAATAVQKGEQLAFVLFPYQHQNQWDEYYWASSFEDKYKGGALYAGPLDDFRLISRVSDFLFRTYVVPIPEPATSFLVLLSIFFATQFRWSFLRARKNSA